MQQIYDVIIVGGGVTGTALAKILAEYTNVFKICILEKNGRVAEVNSHPLNNAQTSHDGSTETNYSLDHALDVQWKAQLLRHYVRLKNDPTLFKVTNRMVLAVGADEVGIITRRFEEFKKYYPDLRLIGAEELAIIEPKVMEGRDPNEPVAALVSDQGFAINYQRLSELMVEDALNSDKDVQAYFHTKVENVYRDSDGMYVLETNQGEMRAKTVVFAAGAFSLLFAKMLGEAKDYTIFPVAGSFFSGGNLLQGKVYRVQIEGMPFAAIHGDADILNQNDTRFGPSTKPLPLMERHHYETIFAYLKTGILSWRGIKSIFKILWSIQMLAYVFKNSLYDIPILGKWLFLKEVRPIVPTIRYRDLTLRRGVGGIRPQLVNMETLSLEMGDSCIVGKNVIFNTTPSPGASICIGNAVRDAIQIVKFLGGEYHFDLQQLLLDLDVADRDLKHDVMHVVA